MTNQLATVQEHGTPIAVQTAELIRAGIRQSTRQSYERAIYALDEWLIGRELTDAVLADYLGILHAEQNKAPSTIAGVVAAVAWGQKYSGRQIVGDITLSTLAGIRTEGAGRGRGQADGLTWEQVDVIVGHCLAEPTIRGLRDAALIRLMSDGLLRVSEAVAVNCGDFGETTVKIRKSKTDQYGRGQSQYICAATRGIISRYRVAAQIEGGALFRWIRAGDNVTKRRLTSRSAQRIIKDRTKRAGYDGVYRSHSLRVGSAVSLARAGASVVQMQQAGRWKDPSMPSHYAQAELASRGAIAQFREEEGR